MRPLGLLRVVLKRRQQSDKATRNTFSKILKSDIKRVLFRMSYPSLDSAIIRLNKQQTKKGNYVILVIINLPTYKKQYHEEP